MHSAWLMTLCSTPHSRREAKSGSIALSFSSSRMSSIVPWDLWSKSSFNSLVSSLRDVRLYSEMLSILRLLRLYASSLHWPSIFNIQLAVCILKELELTRIGARSCIIHFMAFNGTPGAAQG